MTTKAKLHPIESALIHTLETTAETCSDCMSPANVVDGLFEIARSIKSAAKALQSAASTTSSSLEACGSLVHDSLDKIAWKINFDTFSNAIDNHTEAVNDIADALRALAAAVSGASK